MRFRSGRRRRPKPTIKVLSMGDLVKQKTFDAPLQYDLFGNPIIKKNLQDQNSNHDPDYTPYNKGFRILNSYNPLRYPERRNRFTSPIKLPQNDENYRIKSKYMNI